MFNTINSGTILIEGNAFTAEFLRFESEPWTRFYMAGEVIQVIEEPECKTFGRGPAPASSSLPTELVKGRTWRRHWPSRTRISSPLSVFPRALPSDAIRDPRIGRRHWVASFFDRERYCTSHS